MPLGAWQCPAFVLGSGGEERGAELYRILRENFGDAWSQTLEEGNIPAQVAEDVAAARLMLVADRFVDRWRYQSDPLTMAEEFVERWEAILGIDPDSSQTWADRRRAIKAKRADAVSTTPGGVSQIAEDAFAPWETHVHYVGLANAIMWWPGGTATADLFWWSNIAQITIEYVVPAAATQAEIDSRINACFAALDDFAAAWVTFNFSQTQSYGTNANQYGWFLDQPNLDVATFRI